MCIHTYIHIYIHTYIIHKLDTLYTGVSLRCANCDEIRLFNDASISKMICVCQLYLTALYIESVTDSSLGNTIVHSSRLTSLPVGESWLLTLESLFNCPAYSLWALHLRRYGCFGNPLSRVFSSFILWMLKPLVLCVPFSDCSLRPVYLVLKGNSRNMRRAGLNW